MKVKQIFGAFVLAVCTLTAMASPLRQTFELGVIGSGGIGESNQPYGLAANSGSFVDVYKFSLDTSGKWFTGVTATSSNWITFSSGSIDGNELNLSNGKVGLTSQLDAGIHKLVLRGKAGSPTGEWATYNYSIAPVPEPETYAMLLAGLAVIAGVRRKTKD